MVLQDRTLDARERLFGYAEITRHHPRRQFAEHSPRQILVELDIAVFGAVRQYKSFVFAIHYNILGHAIHPDGEFMATVEIFTDKAVGHTQDSCGNNGLPMHE